MSPPCARSTNSQTSPPQGNYPVRSWRPTRHENGIVCGHVHARGLLGLPSTFTTRANVVNTYLDPGRLPDRAGARRPDGAATRALEQDATRWAATAAPCSSSTRSVTNCGKRSRPASMLSSSFPLRRSTDGLRTGRRRPSRHTRRWSAREGRPGRVGRAGCVLDSKRGPSSGVAVPQRRRPLGRRVTGAGGGHSHDGDLVAHEPLVVDRQSYADEVSYSRAAPGERHYERLDQAVSPVPGCAAQR
jgi:hypothetical protein